VPHASYPHQHRVQGSRACHEIVQSHVPSTWGSVGMRCCNKAVPRLSVLAIKHYVPVACCMLRLLVQIFVDCAFALS